MADLVTVLSAVEASQVSKKNASDVVDSDQVKLAAIQAQLDQDKGSFAVSVAQADSDIDAAVAVLLALKSAPAQG